MDIGRRKASPRVRRSARRAAGEHAARGTQPRVCPTTATARSTTEFEVVHPAPVVDSDAPLPPDEPMGTVPPGRVIVHAAAPTRSALR